MLMSMVLFPWQIYNTMYVECGIRHVLKLFDHIQKKIYHLLGKALTLISDFEVPIFLTQQEEITFKYVSGLARYNFSAVQYQIPDYEWTVMCAVRRIRCRVAQKSTGEVDSFAIYSKRKYDLDWMCENDAASDVASHIIKINLSRAYYYGQTPSGN